jgi:hypothetical protein
MTDTRDISAALEIAAALFESDDKGLHPLGSVFAIKAARDYLLGLGVEPRLLAPLAAAVVDIADQYASKGKKLPLGRALPMAQVSLLIDVLLTVDGDLKKACKEAAAASGGAFTAQQIENFRKAVGRSVRRPKQVRAEASSIHDKSRGIKDAMVKLPPAHRHAAAIQTIRSICTSSVKG